MEDPTPPTEEPPVDPAPAPDPAPPANDAPSGIFAEGTTFAENWTDQLEGDEFAETRSTLAQYKDLGSLSKALLDNKRAATARTEGMVKLPTAESTPEEIAEYHKAIGIPETAEGYDIKPPSQLPEGVEFQPEALTAFAEFAHKTGITNEQANALIEFQATVEGQELTRWQEQQEQEQAAEEKKLQQEWGPQWEQKTMLAQRAGATFGINPDHPLMQNADFRRAMAKVGESISEDTLVKGESFSANLSPGNQAADILNNPDNPLHGPYHNKDGTYTAEQQNEAIATRQRLLKEQVRREG